MEGDGSHDVSTLPGCLFVSSPTPGVWLAPGVVACKAPAHAPGTVGLKVSADGAFYSPQVAFLFADGGHVRSLVPSRGPLSGGTAVRVHSPTANASHPWACHFGAIIVPASPRPGTRGVFLCTSPSSPDLAASHVPFAFAMWNEPPSQRLRFAYDAILALVSVEPSAGAREGGCRVTLSGENFIDTPALSCSFGGRTVAAEHLSSMRIACTSPSLPEGGAPVEVANNAHDWTSSGVVFRALATPRLTHLAPRALLALAPSSVLIHADSLRARIPYTCVIGEHVRTEAVWISQTLARCALPPLTPGNYSIALSLPCGSASSSQALSFTVLSCWTITRASPAAGALGASSLITLTGSGFTPLPELRCRVGGAVALATVVGGDVVCQWDGGSYDHREASISLEVSGTRVSTLLFWTAAPPRLPPLLLDVRPSACSQDGGTLLTLTGAGFSPELGAPTCRFGGAATSEATLLWSSTALCSAPAGAPGVISVEVALDGARFSAPLFVMRQPPPAVGRLSPSVGSERGGTIVT